MQPNQLRLSVKNRLVRRLSNKLGKIIYVVLITLFLAILNYFGINVDRPTKSGVVTKVHDGDSFQVTHKVDKEGMPSTLAIRIYGIDAPEFGQDGFFQAKDRLNGLIKGKEVLLKKRGVDQFDRVTAEAFLLDKTDIATLLISEGLVWWEKRFAPNFSHYKELEETARAKNIGIWKNKRPTPPWLFRKNNN